MLPHALLLLLAVTAGVHSFSCDDDKFGTCQNALNQALSLTDNTPWNNPTQFRNKVEAFYENSFTGLRTVCKAFREFKTCMGVNYAQCINPANFVVAAGSTPMNAYQFVSTYNTMHYTCGAGFQIYINNMNCMQTAWKTESINNQLNACRTVFEAKSNGMPDSACQEGNKYLECWEQQFSTACTTSARDAQFWGCEYARVNVFTRFPQCVIRCQLPYNTGIG